MNIREALAELDVHENTLTVEEKRTLDQQGFLHLKGILSQEQVDAINRRLEELLAEEGDKAGTCA